ncbi:MAG: triacylglycerol lipase [Clostridiales bacterium]|jgi:triacylglycerol lipase|nr:triacylglycerol lipase [Clostridiales bacterium]
MKPFKELIGAAAGVFVLFAGSRAFALTDMAFHGNILPAIPAIAVIMAFCLYISIRPVRCDKEAALSARICFGGRRLILYGLLLMASQLAWTTGMFLNSGAEIGWFQVADGVFAWAFTWAVLANGVLRVFLMSKRLRVVRRLLIPLFIWIPIVNIFIMIYLCNVARDEYDHALYKLSIHSAYGGGDACRTRYPLLMLHGVGFRDFKFLNYWGRIPKTLMRRGATIYYGNQEAWGTVESNAADVVKRIDEMLAETGAEKVNILAHSKGGLDARYAVSRLGVADKVASLTTVSTPHRGTPLADVLIRMPGWIQNLIARFVDWYFRAIGDTNPQFLAVGKSFTTGYAARFNDEMPDVSGVYYQSYMSVMRGAFSFAPLSLPYLIIKRASGEENDGLVPVSSSKWGEFKGVFRNRRRRGISHGDIIDLTRRDFSRFDVVSTYVGIVSNLKKQGF